ncbi:MAG: histidinol dehydrogenase [bacterium]|nr:histidinol dehydrogenase [bacterium]MXZ31051.1 histidinol dehydrogenase [Acidimicrobiia bacterium]MYB25419.1 histidinol dehydrogenase [Acidimicrobiia bacterium]
MSRASDPLADGGPSRPTWVSTGRPDSAAQSVGRDTAVPPATTAGPLRLIDARGSAEAAIPDLPRSEPPDIRATVRQIIDEVRRDGDEALRRMARRFDGAALSDLAVPPAACEAALASLAPAVRDALAVAAERIEAFHGAQQEPAHVWSRDGVTVRSRRIPVDRAGLYVPGGRAAYPSTVLMTAIPAKTAGVASLALCVPPRPDGAVAAVTLAAAALAGVPEIYAVGGAGAVAALAYGTETIPRVDLIAGPGNAYVAVAKQEVAGVVGVPAAFAGPSEVVVVADGSAPADLAAADLIVQAEHGPDGMAALVTWDPAVAQAVGAEAAAAIAAAPRRAEIEATLSASGYAVVVENPQQAAAVVNRIAPEHLQLMLADPDELVPLIRHAGAIFCGEHAPASLGDYLAGPSHVLPTGRSARFASVLGTADFSRTTHVITAEEDALVSLGPAVETLATAEGLPAHAASIRRRLDRLAGEDPAGGGP